MGLLSHINTVPALHLLPPRPCSFDGKTAFHKNQNKGETLHIFKIEIYL